MITACRGSCATVALWLGLSACSGAEVPRWAVDTVTIGPGANGLMAIQRWDIFDEPWLEHPAPRHHLCGAVVDLQPRRRAADCPGCVEAWEVTPVLLETDCAESWSTLTSLTAVGIGESGESDPGSLRGWIRIQGADWWSHGEAIEEPSSDETTPGTWTIVTDTTWTLQAEPGGDQP